MWNSVQEIVGTTEETTAGRTHGLPVRSKCVMRERRKSKGPRAQPSPDKDEIVVQMAQLFKRLHPRMACPGVLDKGTSGALMR